jgi:hypothetical protein
MRRLARDFILLLIRVEKLGWNVEKILGGDMLVEFGGARLG